MHNLIRITRTTIESGFAVILDAVMVLVFGVWCVWWIGSIVVVARSPRRRHDHVTRKSIKPPIVALHDGCMAHRSTLLHFCFGTSTLLVHDEDEVFRINSCRIPFLWCDAAEAAFVVDPHIVINSCLVD